MAQKSQIRHILQPKDSKCCGQACIAMVSGLSLEAAISLIGFSCKRWSTKLPREGTALLRIRWKTQETHWVIFYEGIILDPAAILFSTSQLAIAPGDLKNESKIAILISSTEIQKR